MRRLLFTFGLLGFLILGGWLLYHKDQVRGPGDLFRLMGQQISKLSGGATPRFAPWRGHAENVIRIASFNADRFNESKMKDIQIASIMTDIIRQFDVIAIQEINTADPFAMKRFLRRLNSTGRDFRIIPGVPIAGTAADLQSAILYDASTVILEDGQYYHVDDPDNVIARDPLVAWFRTNTEGSAAFTFSLVNVHFDPVNSTNETPQISQIFRVVRNDGRSEDDVILAGDFGMGASQLANVASSQGLQPINGDRSTDTQSSVQLDNFMIDPLATSEFTGETGVYDFMKVYNLTLEQALRVSDHLPIWAEFEVFENESKGQFAERDESTTR